MGWSYSVMRVMEWLVPLLFVVSVGACIGSLTNVLVYRLPLGLDVVTPSSRCPSCRTKLTWRENIPIFGWLMLRGRCRFCRARISPEYPVVEAFVAAVFGVFFTLWYIVPGDAHLAGVPIGGIRPEWAVNGWRATWPVFVSLMTLVTCLIAMTIIDARTFTIPLVLAWVPAAVSVIANPLWAAWVGTHRPWRHLEHGHLWALPTTGLDHWPMVLAAIGATIGLGVGLLLLRFKLVGRSFADYEQWEAGEIDKARAEGKLEEGQDPASLWIQYPHARREMVRELAFLAPCAVLALAGYELGRHAAPSTDVPLWATVLGAVLVGYLVGGGVVWSARIFGSLAFGKEAMGLGDVHLLAAVGACLGWIDSALTFFGACFVGLTLEIVRRPFSKRFRHAMPFGPSLAIAAVLIVLCKPLVELLLGRVLGQPIGLP